MAVLVVVGVRVTVEVAVGVNVPVAVLVQVAVCVAVPVTVLVVVGVRVAVGVAVCVAVLVVVGVRVAVAVNVGVGVGPPPSCGRARYRSKSSPWLKSACARLTPVYTGAGKAGEFFENSTVGPVTTWPSNVVLAHCKRGIPAFPAELYDAIPGLPSWLAVTRKFSNNPPVDESTFNRYTLAPRISSE